MNKNLYYSIYKTLPALLILFVVYTAVMPEIARAQNSSASQNQNSNQDSFGERYREGRDLLDRQEWAKGAEKFREALEKSPDHQLADAALYWLAFCYKKQKKYKEADTSLDRLLEKFSSSAWTSDAKVMKLEIAPLIGRLGVVGSVNAGINPNFSQGQFSSDLQADIVKGTVNGSIQNPTLADKLAMNDRQPLDREDEIKIAAFQSLLTADPKRAVETMGEVLKPDSKASENLKLSIVRVWRNPRLFASNALTDNINKTIGAREFMSLLRETLAKSFENEKNLKVRIEIIYRLASIGDLESLNYLKRFYAAEDEPDIKKDIINSLSIPTGVSYLFNSGRQQSADIINLREESSKIALDFLLEIVRNEKDRELKRLAFANLSRFPNWRTSVSAIETTTRLYDAEANEEFKISLIHALAESKQSAATKKLLDIARSDKSDKLRLEAIYALRNSKDPEVIKFLEDLIK